MGYRSDVYIKAKESMLFDIIKLLEDNELVDSFESKEIKDGYIYLSLPYMKWYYGYDDVANVNDFINQQNDVAMIRVGENGDTDEFGNCSGMDMYTITNVNGF